MDLMVVAIVVGVGLCVLVALYLLLTLKTLGSLRKRAEDSWQDIQTHIEQRAQMIPQLVSTVRAHAQHETAVFDGVDQARAATLSAQQPGEASAAEQQLQKSLKQVFSVAEGYPQLFANQDFLQLQSEILETENKVQSSRRFYNGAVREYNTKMHGFPNAMFAGAFGHKERQFFEVEQLAAISEPPRIDFG